MFSDLQRSPNDGFHVRLPCLEVIGSGEEKGLHVSLSAYLTECLGHDA